MGVRQFFSVILNGKPIKEYSKPIQNLEKFSKGLQESNEKTISKSKEKAKKKLEKPQGYVMRVAVDATFMIYNSVLAYTLQFGDKLTTKGGELTSHIRTIWLKIIQLNKCRFSQIWIFDSPEPNPLKEKENARRNAQKAKGKDPRSQFKITSEHVDAVKKLLSVMGICWLEAPKGIEAEQYGAWMTQGKPEDRYCQYMISGDSDVLLFGGNLMRPVKQKSGTGKSSKTVYELYELENILQQGDISMDDFINIGIAMGTDFNEKIPKVGPKSVEKKVRDGKINQLFSNDHLEAKKYFLMDISNLVGTSQLHKEKYDYEKTIKFLKSKDFNEEDARKYLEKNFHPLD